MLFSKLDGLIHTKRLTEVVADLALEKHLEQVWFVQADLLFEDFDIAGDI